MFCFLVPIAHSTNINFSIINMFSEATLMVKFIVILLIVISIYSWAIMIAKYVILKKLFHTKNKFLKSFWSQTPLDSLSQKYENSKEPFSHLFSTCYWEFQKTFHNSLMSSKDKIFDKIERIAYISILNEEQKLKNNLSLLATIGSVTPFIGLLGTVWGIIDSFHMIGISKNANLQAVAPGIAEALFATALALIVTIPAVIGYNKIVSSINDYITSLECFSNEIITILIKKSESSNGLK